MDLAGEIIKIQPFTVILVAGETPSYPPAGKLPQMTRAPWGVPHVFASWGMGGPGQRYGATLPRCRGTPAHFGPEASRFPRERTLVMSKIESDFFPEASTQHGILILMFGFWGCYHPELQKTRLAAFTAALIRKQESGMKPGSTSVPEFNTL